jgi:hypothetical protein
MSLDEAVKSHPLCSFQSFNNTRFENDPIVLRRLEAIGGLGGGTNNVDVDVEDSEAAYKVDMDEDEDDADSPPSGVDERHRTAALNSDSSDSVPVEGSLFVMVAPKSGS